MKPTEVDLARDSLALFGHTGSLRRISSGLDFSYRVKTSDQVYALRVARALTIRRPSAFLVEAAWIDALSENPWFRIPRLIRTSDGSLTGQVQDRSRVTRSSTLLTWIKGRRCYQIGKQQARSIGQLTGALHQQARSLERPAIGEIKLWDVTRMIGSGRHDALSKFGPEAVKLVQGVSIALGKVLAAIAPTERGLINADIGLHNVLFSEGKAGIVDFNDAGIGPYAFCLGRLVERIRLLDDGEALSRELLSGYRDVTSVPVDYEQHSEQFELAAAVFKLNFGAQRAETRGTVLDAKERRTIRALQKRLDTLEV